MPPITTNNNEVIFHCDGVEFFGALSAEINAVIAAGPGAQTYVRMAYWNAVHDFPLAQGLAPLGGGGPVTLGDLLESKLRELAMHGISAEVILFSPSRTERFQEMADAIYKEHLAFQNWLNNWEVDVGGALVPAQIPGGLSGKVRVFLEEYRPWSPTGIAASNHQKITICSINGQRRVFIGGFNLAQSYWDNVPHTRPSPWHDTGVAIRGPATDGVEAEWMRRWNKSSLPIAANATVQTLYPLTGGGVPNGADGVQVTIATTLTEGGTVRDIRTEMVNRINAAANYIYLENYAFTDPDLTAALVAHAGAGPAPLILVNLAVPTSVYRWLDYVAWAQLAFLTCNNVTVPNPVGGAPLIVNRAGAASWRVLTTPTNLILPEGWLQSTRVQWQLPGLPPPPIRTNSISDISAFTGGMRFCTPGRFSGAGWNPIYLHSKLALFDDQWTVVGTSNWTARSMLYDGEIAAFCNSVPLATNVRARLFGHWNTDPGRGVMDPAAAAFNGNPTAANWDAVVQENAIRLGAGVLTPNNVYCVPLEIGSFDRTPPSDSLGYLTNYTWW